MEDFSVEHNAGADTCPNRREEDIAKAPTRTPKVFGKASGIGVVVHFDVSGVAFGHFVGKGKVAPTRNVRRIDDYASARIKWPGRANPDAPNFRTVGGILREKRFN